MCMRVCVCACRYDRIASPVSQQAVKDREAAKKAPKGAAKAGSTLSKVAKVTLMCCECTEEALARHACTSNTRFWVLR